MNRFMYILVFTTVITKVCFCVIFTNEFVFKLKDEHNSEKIAKSIAEMDGYCTYLGKVGNVPNFYRMYCRPRIKKRGILFHNETFLLKMQSKNQVSLLERQKLQYRVTRSLDPQWTNLWYLNGAVTPSIKIENAWNRGKTGKNIVVGVIDDGIYMTHTDLDANLDVGNSYDYFSGDADANPSSISFSHGTKVSGLIAAEADNNECTIGVAYNSTLIGIRLLGSTSTTDSKEASSLSHNMANIDIYVNSWGPTDGSGFEGPGTAAQAALQNGVNMGRGGKGSIFVWAAGNGGTSDHCNGDGYASSRYVITITAVTFSSTAASYAEMCSTVLAAAYSGDGTKNLISSIVPSGCVSDLQGTSYAVPIAAGIIALALEANPLLTWRDIQHLIVYTSKQYSLSDSVSTWQKNGAQKYVSQVLGFGLLDADAMVAEAGSWTNVPAQISCDGTTESTTLSLRTVWSDTSYFLSGCAIQYLETVSVEISFSYSQYRGLILLTLISPSGTESQILTRRPSDAASTLTSDTLTWTFNSIHFWGEEANGKWTLRFQKTTASMTASITSWRLKVYGTATDPLTAIDQCSSVPCKNNGTCIDKNYGYICICSSAYTGETCNILNTTSGQFMGIKGNDDHSTKIGVSVSAIIVIIVISSLCIKLYINNKVKPESERSNVKEHIEVFVKENEQCEWIFLITRCKTKLIKALQDYAEGILNKYRTSRQHCICQKSNLKQYREKNWNEDGLDQIFDIIIPENSTYVPLCKEYLPALLKVTEMYYGFAFQKCKNRWIFITKTLPIFEKHLERIEKLRVQTIIETLKTQDDLFFPEENWKGMETYLKYIIEDTFEKWKISISFNENDRQLNELLFNVLSELRLEFVRSSLLIKSDNTRGILPNISKVDYETFFKPIFLIICEIYKSSENTKS